MRRLALLGLLILLTAAAPVVPSAIEAMRTAAGKGDADAQFRLAQAYQAGKGLAKDPAMAIMWYRRAVAQGHVLASDELGFALFAHGDRRVAMPYIERAAARGDARAFYLLGIAHFNGDLAARDWPLAYAQTARAAEAGLPAARANLQMMEQYLLSADRAKADIVMATLPPVRPVGGMPPAPPAAPVAAVAPPPIAPAPPPARPGGAWKVQLGAFGTADRARANWDRLTTKVRTLAGLDRHIVAAGKVQRLQAWGVANRADAQALCGNVKAAGGDCLVMAP
jgi:cell division septation protein DedD